jgi:hypothetical protein
MTTTRSLRPPQDAPATEHGCTAQRHGTPSAYDWWGCRCPETREKWRLYRKRLSQGRQPPALVPAVGTARRLQALVAIGYCWRDLGKHLGVSNRRIADIALTPDGQVHRNTVARVDAIFEQLSATPGTAKYAFTLAARYGFVPPLAWDDIDDPSAEPDTGKDRGDSASAPGRDVVDVVAVRRALAGTRVGLTELERHHAVHHGLKRDMPAYLIADRLGLSYTATRRLANQPLPPGFGLAA